MGRSKRKPGEAPAGFYVYTPQPLKISTNGMTKPRQWNRYHFEGIDSTKKGTETEVLVPLVLLLFGKPLNPQPTPLCCFRKFVPAV